MGFSWGLFFLFFFVFSQGSGTSPFVFFGFFGFLQGSGSALLRSDKFGALAGQAQIPSVS